MRFADIAGLALTALNQQKLRTVLTLLGVVIGTFVLLLSLSIGEGVRQTILRELRRNDQLRQIIVWPTWRVDAQDVPAEELAVKGTMSEARRERLRQAILDRWRGTTQRSPRKLLTPERLEELAALEHVTDVIPLIQVNARIHLDGKMTNTMSLSAPPDDPYYRRRIVAGSFFTSEQPRGVVVSEYLLYGLGVCDEADVERVVGKTIRLECSSRQGGHWSVLAVLGVQVPKVEADEEDVLARIAQQLPAAVKRLDLTAREKETLRKMLARSQAPRKPLSFDIREDFTLTGIVRDATREEGRGLFAGPGGNGDFIAPADTLRELYFRMPGARENGVNRVTIVVDSEDHVEAVEKGIRDIGLEPYSLSAVLKNLRLNALLISFATTFVALVALVVAGLGITNTLLMSVLERTHEIGVMKAVGARDWHVQALFLAEGALVGLFGSGLGLLCGWLASIPAERYIHRLAEQQAQTQLEQALLVFPWWLTLGVPLFVTLLTMLAAAYPARRAARVNPMTALRHE